MRARELVLSWRALSASHWSTSSAVRPCSLRGAERGDDPTYWGIGGTNPATYSRAVAAGRVQQDVPVNHNPTFAPVIQPTLDTGTQALVVAALAWIGHPDRSPG
jgi:hypothetical protein